MKIFAVVAALAVLLTACASRGGKPAEVSPLAASRQMILVVSDSWNAPRGTLSLYERVSASAPWMAVRTGVEVELGRSGLGWGRGLVPAPSAEGPVKHEGDGRAPAGIFALGPLFAYADGCRVLAPGMPCLPIRPDTVCVDDDKSPRYNTLFNSEGLTKDWTSDENMLRPDGLYKIGAVVRHNMDDIKPGGGSCIFLHIRRDAGKPTSGCTAMTEDNLRTVLQRLDASARPVMVQLPQAEYARLKPVWNLP